MKDYFLLQFYIYVNPGNTSNSLPDFVNHEEHEGHEEKRVSKKNFLSVAKKRGGESRIKRKKIPELTIKGLTKNSF